jgi:hypothetical protein
MALSPYRPTMDPADQNGSEGDREMLTHPDLALVQAHDRERELIAEADRRRLLVAARRHRRRKAVESPPVRERPGGERSRDVRVAAAR